MTDPTLDAVSDFLHTKFPSVSNLTTWGSGEWSQAFAFDAPTDNDAQPYVIRFGYHLDDYEKDQIAARFAGPDLPIPAIIEIGRALDLHYALSIRAPGIPLIELDEPGLRRVLPAYFRALHALRQVELPATSGFGIWTPNETAPFDTWHAALLDVTNDHPASRAHGWRELLTSPNAPSDAEASFEAGYRHLQELVPRVPQLHPEARHLIHADLVGDNVRVQDNRLTAVVDWGNAMYGDGLYDLARLCFWQPWFPHWRNIDLLAEYRRHLDALGAREPQLEDRLRCYLVYIGLDAQSYNAFTNRWHELARSGARTLEVATIEL